MNRKQHDLRMAIAALAVLIASVEAAAAQDQPQSSEFLKFESTGPQDPRSTGSVGRPNQPLSDKLNSADGRRRATASPVRRARPSAAGLSDPPAESRVPG